ncbi:protein DETOXIFICATION 41 [Citrus sinensis]|uniref:Protein DETOXIFICATION 41 n=1 Tax=Citrus sinensis TaxID=2711 RepID=A0ACB8MZM4_CITSI|nr:protein DETOXIFICATION 41 [Citrus sinensis]
MKQGCHGGWTTRMPATANRILSGLPSDVIEEYLGRQRMAFRWWPRLFGWEWRLLCSFQGLVFAVSIFNYMLTFVTLMFTCHLSALELAGDSTASIWTYIKLTVASTVMLCLEIWYNQGLAPISGLLPNPTILLDSVSVRSQVSYNAANFDILVVWFLSESVMLIFFKLIAAFDAVVLIFRADLSKPFASDSEVVQAVSNLIPSLAISVFLNGIQPILSGVAIGSGWQAIVAYVNLACYYIMGLPMGSIYHNWYCFRLKKQFINTIQFMDLIVVTIHYGLRFLLEF